MDPAYVTDDRIRSARPFKIPAKRITLIATGRLEEFRDTTEEWLQKYRVRHEHLVMRPSFLDNIVDIKVKAIREYKPDIFWESEHRQATAIHLETGINVLCFENMVLYGGRSK